MTKEDIITNLKELGIRKPKEKQVEIYIKQNNIILDDVISENDNEGDIEKADKKSCNEDCDGSKLENKPGVKRFTVSELLVGFGYLGCIMEMILMFTNIGSSTNHRDGLIISIVAMISICTYSKDIYGGAKRKLTYFAAILLDVIAVGDVFITRVLNINKDFKDLNVFQSNYKWVLLVYVVLLVVIMSDFVGIMRRDVTNSEDGNEEKTEEKK